jgi:hypothetical protein
MLNRRRAVSNDSVDSEIAAQEKFMPAIHEDVLKPGTDMNRSFI